MKSKLLENRYRISSLRVRSQPKVFKDQSKALQQVWMKTRNLVAFKFHKMWSRPYLISSKKETLKLSKLSKKRSGSTSLRSLMKKWITAPFLRQLRSKMRTDLSKWLNIWYPRVARFLSRTSWIRQHSSMLQEKERATWLISWWAMDATLTTLTRMIRLRSFTPREKEWLRLVRSSFSMEQIAILLIKTDKLHFTMQSDRVSTKQSNSSSRTEPTLIMKTINSRLLCISPREATSSRSWTSWPWAVPGDLKIFGNSNRLKRRKSVKLSPPLMN